MHLPFGVRNKHSHIFFPDADGQTGFPSGHHPKCYHPVLAYRPCRTGFSQGVFDHKSFRDDFLRLDFLGHGPRRPEYERPGKQAGRAHSEAPVKAEVILLAADVILERFKPGLDVHGFPLKWMAVDDANQFMFYFRPRPGSFMKGGEEEGVEGKEWWVRVFLFLRRPIPRWLSGR